MKKIGFIFSFFVIMLFASCCTTTAQVYSDDGVCIEAYYDDAVYVGYNIVWIGDWPYWHRHDRFIPYHHNHILRYRPHPSQIRIARQKPRLYNGRYYHPSWRQTPPPKPRPNYNGRQPERRPSFHNDLNRGNKPQFRQGHTTHRRNTPVHIGNDNRRSSR